MVVCSTERIVLNCVLLEGVARGILSMHYGRCGMVALLLVALQPARSLAFSVTTWHIHSSLVGLGRAHLSDSVALAVTTLRSQFTLVGVNSPAPFELELVAGHKAGGFLV